MIRNVFQVFFKSCVFTSEKLVNSPRSSPYCATDATCTTARLYYAAHWKRPPRVVDNRIRSESLNQFKGFRSRWPTLHSGEFSIRRGNFDSFSRSEIVYFLQIFHPTSPPVVLTLMITDKQRVDVFTCLSFFSQKESQWEQIRPAKNLIPFRILSVEKPFNLGWSIANITT